MQVILKQLTGQKLAVLHSIKQKVGPCERIWISESGLFLFVKSEILGFGIRNTAQGIRNPRLEDWNPVPGIQNPRPRIENPKPSRITSHGVKQGQL